MKEIKKQTNIIKEIRKTQSKYKDIGLSFLHYKYLLGFFKRHKFYIIRLIVLIFVIGILESFLILFAKNQIFNAHELLGSFFWYFFAIFILVFIISSFFIIKQEKTIEVLFANDIRRRILKFFIEKPIKQMNYTKQGNLIAKISYQLPLVSMGVSNVFFSSIEWIVCFAIIIFISYLINLNIFFVITSFIGLSFAIGIFAYYISKKYISQEVTFFTHIMRNISTNLSEKYFNKNFRQEFSFLNKIDHLVNIDSFFRIRRNLWMKMGFQMVFVIFLFIMVLSSFSREDFSSWNSIFVSEDKFLFLFLIYYFPKAFSHALRFGLYLFPAKLGLFLTINKRGNFSHSNKSLRLKKYICFSAKKIKFFEEGKYFRNINLVFERGERILFFGKSFSGKTSLAKAFCAIEAYNKRALKVKIDDKKFDYLVWQRFFQDVYFFDPNVKSEKSLIEFILGKNKEEIDIVDIEKVVKIISENDFIASKISYLSNFNFSCSRVLENTTQAFALHALHCIANKPSLVVIDNIWLDTNYDDIIKILNIISENLPDSIIVVFSRENNNYLNYQQKYELDNEIKKITE